MGLWDFIEKLFTTGDVNEQTLSNDEWKRLDKVKGQKPDKPLTGLKKKTPSDKAIENLRNNQYKPGGQGWTMEDWDRQNQIRKQYELQQQLQQQQQASTRDTLFQQLLVGLNAGQPQQMSIEDIRKQAAASINPQYNPQINAIKELMGDARSSAKANAKDIKALYADLAGSYKEDSAWMKKELQGLKGDEAKALGALQQTIDTQYDTQAEDMANEFQKLGIEAAYPTATEGMRSDADFLNALTQTESGAQQRLYDSMLANNAGFFAQGSSIARQYGAEAAQRLFANLDSYLTDSRTQISTLEGQRAGALSELINSMQQSQTGSMAQWDSDRWSRMAQLYQMLGTSENQDFNQQLQLMKLQQQMAGGNSPEQQQATRGIQGAYGVLQGLLGEQSTNAISALQNFLQSTTQRTGSFEGENGDYYDMTPQQAAFEARKFAAQSKLTPAETDALVQAVFAYYGKLR